MPRFSQFVQTLIKISTKKNSSKKPTHLKPPPKSNKMTPIKSSKQFYLNKDNTKKN